MGKSGKTAPETIFYEVPQSKKLSLAEIKKSPSLSPFKERIKK